MLSANPNPLIYAVVLNWNGAEETMMCLRSLQVQTYPALRLVVVDNGSGDDSIARLRAACPDVEILANAENRGFAGGMNVGLRHALAAGADYILALNNDLELDPDCVAEMARHIAPDVAFITGVVYYSDDRRRIWSIGGHIHPWTLEKTADARGVLDEGQLPSVLPRHFTPGGATLMARAALEEVGLFDEGFFLYYEDADLSLRAHRAGWRSLAATQARMWHGVSVSAGGRDSPRERYWMARSSVRYFTRNAAWRQTPLILFWRSGSALRTTWRLWRTQRYTSLRAYWRGLWHGIQDWHRPAPPAS